MRIILILLFIILFKESEGQSTTSEVPRTYIARYVRTGPLIDGRALPGEWDRAEWSAAFVDIEGENKPAPAYNTRMKMIWDHTFLYILIEIEEPDLWATLTRHDDIVYRDHDAEVFIDPDGDTNRYIEIEINAFGTVMDLYMDKPYKKRGTADMTWNATMMHKAVGIYGTLNDGSDIDTGWTVEMAIPFDMITEVTGDPAPKPGSQWRINFSRVEWLMEKEGKGYRKKVRSDGKSLPEQNWVWSPQGVIDMHVPEKWGILRFLK